jgi:hypothetical protein
MNRAVSRLYVQEDTARKPPEKAKGNLPGIELPEVSRDRP